MHDKIHKKYKISYCKHMVDINLLLKKESIIKNVIAYAAAYCFQLNNNAIFHLFQ